MKKILHLINYPGKGGSERYILSLAKKLHGKDCLFFLSYGMEGPLVSQMHELGIETFLLPMKSPWDTAAARILKQYCSEKGIEIVHTHFLRENFISIASKIMGNRVGLVNTVHMMDAKTGIIKAVNRWATRFDDRIIVVSKAVKAVQQGEGISAHKLQLIYNGVEIPQPEFNDDLYRKNLGVDQDQFLITSAARFSEEKGHLFLLDAIKMVKEILIYKKEVLGKIRFVLAGDGPLLESCREIACRMGIDDLILFTGFFSDVTQLLHTSDLYVSHSQSEALGISILEALACGLPVVATDSGGPSEIVNEDNGVGILVDKNDAEGYARAIVKMITDRDFYDSCRKRTKSLVQSRFSLDHMADETFKVYQAVTDSRR